METLLGKQHEAAKAKSVRVVPFCACVPGFWWLLVFSTGDRARRRAGANMPLNSSLAVHSREQHTGAGAGRPGLTPPPPTPTPSTRLARRRYDSVPSDIGTLFVVKHIKEALGRQTAEVTTVVIEGMSGVSGGTMSTGEAGPGGVGPERRREGAPPTRCCMHSALLTCAACMAVSPAG